MISFIKKVLLLAFAAALAASLFLTFNRLEENTAGIVRDAESGRIVRLFMDKYNFVWQGAAVWRYGISRIPLQYSWTGEVRVPFPQMELLSGNQYSVLIPVHLIYRIEPASFFNLDALNDDRKGLGDMIGRFAGGAFSDSLRPFLSPEYRRGEAVQQWNSVVEKTKDDVASKLSPSGISLVRFESAGVPVFPDAVTYKEGLQHSYDMRKIGEQNEKDLAVLKNKIERDRLLRQEQVKELEEMSKLIKLNPDILKYIYIDKLGGNVKVIISPANSGLPFGLDSMMVKPSEKKEIDNLK